MKNFFLFLYYILGAYLPSSYFPGGEVFNSIRVFLINQLVDKLGKYNKIQKGVYLGRGIGIEIGDYCQINENVKMDNVRIGNYVMIAPGVTILGRMHEYRKREKPMIFQGLVEVNQTIIEDDVWIGTNAIIMPGVKISKGSIIGAGCVLTKNTNPFEIFAGVPGRLISIRPES